MKVVDDFEKSLMSALDQFTVALHSDLRKASVSTDTLLRVGRQQRSTVIAKVCSVSLQFSVLNISAVISVNHFIPMSCGIFSVEISGCDLMMGHRHLVSKKPA